MATFYKFKAYGKTVVVDSRDLNGFDPLMELGDAMCIANEEILWATPEAKEGCWELNETEADHHTTYTYYWEETSTMPLCGGIIAD